MTAPDMRTRAAIYIAVLTLLNFYFASNLFFVEFTDNMQTNAGSFMAIGRFVQEHFPHLNWFPWWFNGVPFENSYTPMLHLMDAGLAWIGGISPARAYNFTTGFFYVIGPSFLFLFAWRVSGLLETSFFAGLLYSLFSPANMFRFFRADVGLWNPLRLRVLMHWGEGPHIVALSVLPLALLATYRALTTRKRIYSVGAAVSMAWIVLVNSFGAVDLALGCVCLVAMLPRKEIPAAALRVAAIAAVAYLLAISFLTPSWIRTMSQSSQHVDGNFRSADMAGIQLAILASAVVLWWVTRHLTDYFLRVGVMFTFVMFAIVGFYVVGGIPSLPQPHRYSVELEMGACLAAAWCLRSLVLRFPKWMKVAAVALVIAASAHQIFHYRRSARELTRGIDVTQTSEYRVAKWLGSNLAGQRTFVSGQTGTWLNVFADVPQLNSGHQPFDPNFRVDSGVVYQIYAGMDPRFSILWLKAFGCRAIHVGRSRLYGEIFPYPRKFEGSLLVLWRDGDEVIYSVPQRTKSLAHVVPEAAIVKDEPVNGIDTGAVERYVAALDDTAMPSDVMRWFGPERGRLETTLRPGQVVSVQVTYDPGWVATANGRPAEVSRDGLGLSVVHPACDGACTVEFYFDGGMGRKVYRFISGATLVGVVLLLFWRRERTEAEASVAG
jgi:hypothetical protein